MNCAGVYAIDNRVNGKIYIGSSRNIKSRWLGHLSDLRIGRHHSPLLQHSWNKHGESAFRLSLLETCDESSLLTVEQRWLDNLQPELNVLRVAGRPTGRKATAETIAKMSAANKGKVIPPEVRKKISDTMTGVKLDRARVEKSANSRRGRKGHILSESSRAKISAKLKGRKLGPRSLETRAKISAAKIGTKLSEASKLKISEARRGKGLGPCSQQKRESIAKAKASFSEDQIRQIRRTCESGASHRNVAKQFQCSKTCVSFIAKRKSYAWVLDA